MSATSTKDLESNFGFSLGTMIEWYDFYILVVVGVVISTKFSQYNPPPPSATLAFAVGFVVRPFGALFFD
jgi:hypothetical protein